MKINLLAGFASKNTKRYCLPHFPSSPKSSPWFSHALTDSTQFRASEGVGVVGVVEQRLATRMTSYHCKSWLRPYGLEQFLTFVRKSLFFCLTLWEVLSACMTSQNGSNHHKSKWGPGNLTYCKYLHAVQDVEDMWGFITFCTIKIRKTKQNTKP